jgi:pimeloyl-ACP methyl ester carboxylesterase
MEFDDIQKYYEQQGYKVSTTGHSLGGSIARYVHQERGDKVHQAHMFNPGTSLSQQTHLKEGAYSHFINYDPVSVLGINNDSNVFVYDGLSNNDNVVDNHYMKSFFGE